MAKKKPKPRKAAPAKSKGKKPGVKVSPVKKKKVMVRPRSKADVVRAREAPDLHSPHEPDLSTAMQSFANQLFTQAKDRDSGAVYEDYSFHKCTFDNCLLSFTNQPALRSTVRRCTATHCMVVNSIVGPALFDEVTVDGLSVNDLLILTEPLFRHVTLRGKIGQIKINTRLSYLDYSAAALRAFPRSRIAFYKNVDWALDIREAQFLDFDMRGIPAALVRRDPETQFVVKREKAMAIDRDHVISKWNDYWAMMINSFLADEDPDVVFVIPRGKRKETTRKLTDGLKELRDIGVAELD